MSTRAEWLASEPFTLALGAGFFGFFAHTGLLQALEDAAIVPSAIVGVSAGALAGGLWASGMSGRAIERELVALRREDFWDPGLPLGGLLRGRKFTAKLQAVLGEGGVDRIEDCRVPFTAVAHDVIRRRSVEIDRGPLHVAIQASCTVPFMFRPLVRDGRILVDGGVSDRSGLGAVSDPQRVFLHWLPSRRRLRLSAPERTPTPDGLVLVTPGLPRVGPFALQQGPVALARARQHVAAWLRETI